MSIQLYENKAGTAQGSGQESGALVVLPNGLQITEEEQQKRIKDAEELEEKLKYITEKVPTRIMNVSGSNAGAGSGEFHMYRMARRREQMRLLRIDEQQKEEEEQRALEEKTRRLQEQDEARTSKRRAQREKKKKKKKRAKTTDGGLLAKEVDHGSDSGSEGPEQPALD